MTDQEQANDVTAATTASELVVQEPAEVAAPESTIPAPASAGTKLEDSAIVVREESAPASTEATVTATANAETSAPKEETKVVAAVAELKEEPVQVAEAEKSPEPVVAAETKEEQQVAPEELTTLEKVLGAGSTTPKRQSTSHSLQGSPSLSNVRDYTNRFSTSYRPMSPASSISRRSSLMPIARTVTDGPPLPIAAVTAAVRSTNPILEELLYSIKLLGENDASLTVLDLKDATVFSVEHGSALAEALETNTHLKELNLCNAKVATSTASELAHALKSNTTLETLNLESNSIGPIGMKHLAEALAVNTSILELRLINQKAPAGIDAEQTFARSLAKNTSVIKLGLQFRDVAARNACDRAIMRNKDAARRRRLSLAAKQ
ncbi:hypothetical protein HDU78_002663 [Chytriomyces hyalinus]|nr:hypothetical protein HDU78_002663 [Chytriomyces hyalinus]